MYSPKRRLRLFRHPAWAGGDQIAASLTTSLATYTAAATGVWVKITSGEYATLQTKVADTTLVGTTAATYTAIGTNTNFTTGPLLLTNVVGASTPAVPANSYIYAVAFYYNGTTSSFAAYANDSTTSYTNFSKIGATLPTTTAGNNYYVLKNPGNVTAPTTGNFAMWSTEVLNHGFKQSVSASGIRYTSTGTPSSSSTLSSTFANASAFSIQGLTTTAKQW